MRKTVKVRLPAELDDSELPDFVSTTVGSYYDALDTQAPDEAEGDARGPRAPAASAPAIAAHDIRITSVAVSDDAVAVNYQLPPAAAGAPADADALAEAPQRVLMGERRGRWLIFQRFFPSGARRSR